MMKWFRGLSGPSLSAYEGAGVTIRTQFLQSVTVNDQRRAIEEARDIVGRNSLRKPTAVRVSITKRGIEIADVQSKSIIRKAPMSAVSKVYHEDGFLYLSLSLPTQTPRLRARFCLVFQGKQTLEVAKHIQTVVNLLAEAYNAAPPSQKATQSTTPSDHAQNATTTTTTTTTTSPPAPFATAHSHSKLSVDKNATNAPPEPPSLDALQRVQRRRSQMDVLPPLPPTQSTQQATTATAPHNATYDVPSIRPALSSPNVQTEARTTAHGAPKRPLPDVPPQVSQSSRPALALSTTEKGQVARSISHGRTGALPTPPESATSHNRPPSIGLITPLASDDEDADSSDGDDLPGPSTAALTASNKKNDAAELSLLDPHGKRWSCINCGALNSARIHDQCRRCQVLRKHAPDSGTDSDTGDDPASLVSAARRVEGTGTQLRARGSDHGATHGRPRLASQSYRGMPAPIQLAGVTATSSSTDAGDDSHATLTASRKLLQDADYSCYLDSDEGGDDDAAVAGSEEALRRKHAELLALVSQKGLSFKVVNDVLYSVVKKDEDGARTPDRHIGGAKGMPKPLSSTKSSSKQSKRADGLPALPPRAYSSSFVDQLLATPFSQLQLNAANAPVKETPASSQHAFSSTNPFASLSARTQGVEADPATDSSPNKSKRDALSSEGSAPATSPVTHASRKASSQRSGGKRPKRVQPAIPSSPATPTEAGESQSSSEADALHRRQRPSNPFRASNDESSLQDTNKEARAIVFNISNPFASLMDSSDVDAVLAKESPKRTQAGNKQKASIESQKGSQNASRNAHRSPGKESVLPSPGGLLVVNDYETARPSSRSSTRSDRSAHVMMADVPMPVTNLDDSGEKFLPSPRVSFAHVVDSASDADADGSEVDDDDDRDAAMVNSDVEGASSDEEDFMSLGEVTGKAFGDEDSEEDSSSNAGEYLEIQGEESDFDENMINSDGDDESDADANMINSDAGSESDADANMINSDAGSESDADANMINSDAGSESDANTSDDEFEAATVQSYHSEDSSDPDSVSQSDADTREGPAPTMKPKKKTKKGGLSKNNPSDKRSDKGHISLVQSYSSSDAEEEIDVDAFC